MVIEMFAELKKNLQLKRRVIDNNKVKIQPQPWWKSTGLSRYCSYAVLFGFVHGSSGVSAQNQTEYPTLEQNQIVKDFEALQESKASIPPVSERRNQGSGGGDRISVARFQINSLNEYPERGITMASVNAFLEAQRIKALKEDEIKETGYTKQEVSEILQFVTRIKARADILLTEDDLVDLEDLLYRQQERRGLTIDDIANIAQRLTDFYRQQGFFLAKAFIPAQEVAQGVIKLQVLEGTLGEVSVTGNQKYDSPVLEKAVSGLMGKTVTKDTIESALYTLNDYPGVNANGYFSASQNVGETKLTIQVNEEKTWSSFLRLDNHGSDLTGKTRAFGIYERFNVTGNADKLRLGVLQSEGPDDATFGLAEYRIPIGSGSDAIQLSTSSNEFTASGQGNSNLGVEGETTIYEAAWSRSFIRSRTNNLSSKLAFTYKDTSTQVGSGTGLSTDQRIRGGVASLNFDSLFEEQKILLQGNLDLRYGRFNTGEQDGQNQEYYILAENFSSLFFVNIPFTDVASRLVLRSSGQFTEQPLPAVDQFSLGGANAVRAFTVSDFSADSGAYLGLEYYVDLPEVLTIPYFGGERKALSQFLQPYLFYDYAYGVRRGFNNGSGNQDSFSELTGYGLGLQFNFDPYLSGRINFARQASSKFSEDQMNEPRDRLRIFVDFTFKFQ